MKYHIILQPVVSIKIGNIEAASPLDAIKQAEDFIEQQQIWRQLNILDGPATPDPDSPMGLLYITAEDWQCEHALVDEAGDEDFTNSEWWLHTPSGWHKEFEDITLRVPAEAWNLLRETLENDSQSAAFDPELREKIRQALQNIQEIIEAQ